MGLSEEGGGNTPDTATGTGQSQNASNQLGLRREAARNLNQLALKLLGAATEKKQKRNVRT